MQLLRRRVHPAPKPQPEPIAPGLALQLAIDQHTAALARAIRAYAQAGGPEDAPLGARLIYAEHLALDELINLLAVVHARLDNVMPPDSVEHVERKHELLRDWAAGYFIPQAMNYAVDAAAERDEDPMDALFDDVDVYSAVALNAAGYSLGGPK